jgi:hypothetical protein
MRTKPDQTFWWALPISSVESPVRLPPDGAFVCHMLLTAALAVIYGKRVISARMEGKTWVGLLHA